MLWYATHLQLFGHSASDKIKPSLMISRTYLGRRIGFFLSSHRAVVRFLHNTIRITLLPILPAGEVRGLKLCLRFPSLVLFAPSTKVLCLVDKYPLHILDNKNSIHCLQLNILIFLSNVNLISQFVDVFMLLYSKFLFYWVTEF